LDFLSLLEEPCPILIPVFLKEKIRSRGFPACNGEVNLVPLGVLCSVGRRGSDGMRGILNCHEVPIDRAMSTKLASRKCFPKKCVFEGINRLFALKAGKIRSPKQTGFESDEIMPTPLATQGNSSMPRLPLKHSSIQD
jgi:hypothetical protein